MIELYEHQKVALDLLRLNDSFGLFMEQGTGKTFPVLFRLTELIEEKKINSVGIVAPKAVCGSWEEKIEQLDAKQQNLFNTINVDVISYDSIWRPKYKDKVYDCIVLDEAHYIKNNAAKRTKACLKKCQRAKYRYILTGTPTSNGQLSNLYSEMAALTPTQDTKNVYPQLFGGVSYTKWINQYAYLNQYWQPYKYHHVDELQKLVKTITYRITKSECLDLPAKLPNEIWKLDMDVKTKSLYRNISKNSCDIENDILADNPLTKMLRLRQLASGFVSNDVDEVITLNNNKLKLLIEYLTNADTKTVIFCSFRKSIDDIDEQLTKQKINHVIIDGRTKDKQICKKFQNEDGVRVCICQYASGSAGIDLYASSTCIFYEPTLSSNLHEQARDRIHRIGQNNHCQYIYMLTTGSIEFSIYNALLNYQDFNEKLFTKYISEYTKGGRI